MRTLTANIQPVTRKEHMKTTRTLLTTLALCSATILANHAHAQLVGSHVEATNTTANSYFLGKVGIGTASPQAPLDVGTWTGIPSDISNVGMSAQGNVYFGNVGYNVARFRMAANANSGSITFNDYWNGSTTRSMNGTKPSWKLTLHGLGDYFSILRAAASETRDNVVYETLFNINGTTKRVGIGTVSATETLHVAGKGRFDEGISYIAPLGDLSMGTYTNSPSL